jgi:hypothetical protein
MIIGEFFSLFNLMSKLDHYPSFVCGGVFANFPDVIASRRRGNLLLATKVHFLLRPPRRLRSSRRQRGLSVPAEGVAISWSFSFPDLTYSAEDSRNEAGVMISYFN